MKFYFRASNKEQRDIGLAKKKRNAHYKLCGYNTLRERRERSLSPIPLIDISEFMRALDIPKIEPPRRKRKKTFLFRRLVLFVRISAMRFAKCFKRKHTPSPRLSPQMLAGLLSSALLVAVFTGFASVFPYLFKYTRSYTPVTIPDFTIYTYDELLAVTKEYDTFNFVVEFTDNVYAEGGEIISQSPRADTKRRMYDNERLTVTVTVCSYDESFTMKDYIGGSARDAELELRNLGFKVKVVNKYSGSIPAGSVIATSPQINEVMTEGGYVTLTVSRGKRISYSLLPNLVGLSEASAIKKLKNLGFTIGEIKYSASESAAGTVIAQSKKRGSSLAQGTTISLTVSTGNDHTARKVPDLLGLTLEEAKNALREAGLALGKVYYINEEDGDAEGLTVVKQTPPAKIEISSSVVSVDIHLG